MNLSESELEEILYNSPWIIDELYDIPKIEGPSFLGRQINVGHDKLVRKIDLIFKDRRDNRPVIIELKIVPLRRKHVGQLLEYRGLIHSMEDEMISAWKAEFGHLFNCPKLMLIGPECNVEVEISANLAGIEIRTYDNHYLKSLKFSELQHKLQFLTNNRQSGYPAVSQRQEWVEKIRSRLEQYCTKSSQEDLSTVTEQSVTNKRNSYLQDIRFPFLNLPLLFNDEVILGFYEYHEECSGSDEERWYI